MTLSPDLFLQTKTPLASFAAAASGPKETAKVPLRRPQLSKPCVQVRQRRLRDAEPGFRGARISRRDGLQVSAGLCFWSWLGVRAQGKGGFWVHGSAVHHAT